MSASAAGPPIPFSELPLDKSHVDAWYNTWGLYGQDDQKGFLNRVTDEMVAKAAKEEIRTGKRINLDMALGFQGPTTFFSRKPFHQEIILKTPRCVTDDVWTFNSQATSQWDGLRHYAYQKPRRFYNNISAEQIVDPGPAASSATNVNPTTDPKFLGVHNYADRGIVGRGVLLDFARWRDQQLSPSTSSALPADELQELQSFQPFHPNPIRHNWLLATLASQGTIPQYGDILIIRSGFLRSYAQLNASEIAALAAKTPVPACGVEQCKTTLRWVWDTFSAVAGDQPSFEAWPAPAPTSEAKRDEQQGKGPAWSYHEILLAGWGCPIGELFDLEELSRECERHGRWSFFVSSCANNVPGGVASPPNCLAIF